VQPAIAARGAALAVVGPSRSEHIPAFREATGYGGALYVDPSLDSFREAGLARGWAETFHPLAMVKGVRAFAGGFRQGARRGDPIQQGGTFVLGPGDAARFEWRDRHAGDHPSPSEVVAALDRRRA
jgi:AhpC/TSA antioxidant enzyme